MRESIRICGILLLFAIFPWTAGSASAQAGGEWQPITQADLGLKDNPASPGADAMILYRESTVSDEDVNAHGDSDQEYIRIKIFTDAGKRYADVEIPYLVSQGDEPDEFTSTTGAMQIFGVRGRTIHPDGTITNFDGKVYDKLVLKSGGFKVKAASFTLPDVQPGCIIEYKYKKQGEPGWLHDEEWTVSQDIFTREAHFTFIPPSEYVGYVPYYRMYGLSRDSVPKCGIGVKHACEMEAQNIRAVVDEPLMPPKKAMEARVEWYFQSEGAQGTESADRYWNRMGKKWGDELDRFVNKKGALQDEASRIVSASDTPEMKLRKIYARVQQIRNLSYEATKSNQEKKAEKVKKVGNAEDILKDGYGNGRNINFLFVGLARGAGFEAKEIYVTPRNTDLFEPLEEDAEQLTADVVWVRAGGKEYFLDPAAKYYPFGLLPWFETQVKGIKASKDGGQEVLTPSTDASEASVLRRADLEIGADGSVNGKIQVDFTGEEAGRLRTQEYKEDETGRKKDLEDQIKGWLPTGATFEITNIADWDNNEKPVHVEGTVKIQGLGAEAGHRILLPADFFATSDAEDFRAEKRVNAVYFPYPFQEVDDLTFTAPQGYKIEAAPKGQDVNAGAAKYNLTASEKSNSVEVKRQFLINGVVFSKDAYPVLRSFFNLAKSYDNSQIVMENTETAKSN